MKRLSLLALALSSVAQAQGAAGCLVPDSVRSLRLMFAMAPRCTRIWVDSLNSSHNETRWVAQRSLATVGGREAVDALRASYDRAPSPIVAGILVNAMGTTGSPEDIAFLKTQIARPDDGDSWPVIQAATTALAFLRVADIRDRLRELATTSPTRFTGVAAKRALEMLDRPPCIDSVSATGASLDRELFRIVMECRPQALGTEGIYSDESTGRVWQFTDGAWRARGRTSRDKPRGTITSNVTIVPEQGVAFVSVSMYCGSLCGEGWTYRLRRTGNAWQVIAATFEWVS